MYIAGSKNTIDTGNTYFLEIAKLNVSGSESAKKQLLLRERLTKLDIYDGKPLEARIEYSRWIVDCPNCNNAEFMFEDGLFFCSLCNNSDVNSQVRKVKLPKERKRIEEILIKRPIKNRHWFASETVEDLENGNKNRNLEVR